MKFVTNTKESEVTEFKHVIAIKTLDTCFYFNYLEKLSFYIRKLMSVGSVGSEIHHPSHMHQYMIS